MKTEKKPPHRVTLLLQRFEELIVAEHTIRRFMSVSPERDRVLRTLDAEQQAIKEEILRGVRTA